MIQTCSQVVQLQVELYDDTHLEEPRSYRSRRKTPKEVDMTYHNLTHNNLNEVR